MNLVFKTALCIAFLLFIIFVALTPMLIKEGFDLEENNSKVFVINLDKDKDRLKEFTQYYQESDFKDIPLNRFPGIQGNNVNSDEWIAPHAKTDYQRNIITKKREKHHELSQGGLGCFMSHLELAKQLTEEQDPAIQQYIVFEDDSKCKSNSKSDLHKYMSYLPKDWDFFIAHPLRNNGKTINEYIKKPSSFWGLGLYVINKEGAKKLIQEVEEKKIDGQIDCYLSRMNQQNNMNVYTCYKSLVDDNSHNMSNIQITLEENGKDPFDYYGTPL